MRHGLQAHSDAETVDKLSRIFHLPIPANISIAPQTRASPSLFETRGNARHSFNLLPEELGDQSYRTRIYGKLGPGLMPWVWPYVYNTFTFEESDNGFETEDPSRL